MTKRALVFSLGLAVAACGGDDNSGTPDASPDAPVDAPQNGVCGTPVTTLSTYPATFVGQTLGAGHNFTVDDGACTDQNGWFGSAGEDQAIALTGLTAGTHYLVELATDDDLTFYMTTGCEGDSPAAGACLTHVDHQFTTEIGEFDAPASGKVYLIVDSADDPVPTIGSYALSIYTSECNDSAQCPGEICLHDRCVGCEDDYGCSAATAVCDTLTHACNAGHATCTGDDVNEPDDGPLAGHPLAFPTATTPTTTTAAICSAPTAERDWFTIVAPAAGDVRVSITWTTPGADLDFRLYDAAGTEVGKGISTETTSEIAVVTVSAAGSYGLEIRQYDPPTTAAATPYTLNLALPECEDDFDCPAPRPLCDGGGSCVAGAATCTADDGGEPDDGPAAARLLNGAIGVAVVRPAAICNSPATEVDWYRIDVGDGEGARVELAWPTATDDLDVAVFDASGEPVGIGFWLRPEVVTLTYLPAGAYYIRVKQVVTPAVTAAVPYTITATRTVAQTCASSTDCAAVYSNQFYRGACTGGSCHFIAPGAAADGAACDSADDCMSRHCSYLLFEDDAQRSVCTTTCATSTECPTNFACTAGFAINECVPKCARDLDCGADVGSDLINIGEPWDYLVCTATSGVCTLP